MSDRVVTSYAGPLAAVLVPMCTPGWPAIVQFGLMVVVAVAAVAAQNLYEFIVRARQRDPEAWVLVRPVR